MKVLVVRQTIKTKWGQVGMGGETFKSVTSVED